MKSTDLRTPCYVISEAGLIHNGEILDRLRKKTGCKILLAQKCFSNYALYPLLSRYLDGSEASGLYEARLGKTHFPGECHIFSAGYRDDEFDEILSYADHLVFNSVKQLEKFAHRAKSAGKSIGLRVNPECSTQQGHAIYDPCAPGSRLGARLDTLTDAAPELIAQLDGLHFHTLCEQDSDALELTLDAVEEKFGFLLDTLKWINFGGGHHITREGYDLARLEHCIDRMTRRGLTVYLEPGEAVALNAGKLLTTVLEIQKPAPDGDAIPCVILDTSAACHMPDVLEMPYRPPLAEAGEAGELPYSYRLGSQTCLAGDVLGVYSFDHPLCEGDRLCFEDMAIYTMVKNNTFNGMPLPDIVVEHPDGECDLLRRFGYEDFYTRL